MASGTDIDMHWALACLTLMSFDSAAEFQVTEVPAVSDGVCVLLRSALNFLQSAKASSKQPLHVADLAPPPLFASTSAAHKATVTATAVCDVCSVILHNLSLLPANHGALSSLQCTIALLSACANARLCPAVALRSVNVLAALTRAGAVHNVDPVRWAWGIEGVVAFSVGRVVAGHHDPDVLEFSLQSPDTFVTCTGLSASALTDPVDVAASSLNMIIVAATSSECRCESRALFAFSQLFVLCAGSLSSLLRHVTSATVRDVCDLAISGSAVQSRSVTAFMRIAWCVLGVLARVECVPLLMQACRQALNALFYLIAAEPSHIVAAKSQVSSPMPALANLNPNPSPVTRCSLSLAPFAVLGSLKMCVCHCLILRAAAAVDGVSLGYPWLPDGRHEARHGVSADAASCFACISCCPPARCVGCSSDSGAQTPELDMLFQMIRAI
jgi:hypothetical protein